MRRLARRVGDFAVIVLAVLAFLVLCAAERAEDGGAIE